MRPGDVVNERFELERQAGSGGMATVFKGRDRASGNVVAVKVLLDDGMIEKARFEREARVLEKLSHPGIVRYVAHGVTPGGEPYLAMEWLEGEDLLSRLCRARLTVEDSVGLATRVARALGAVHACGVVHRDLKPSNLFLVGGQIEQVKLLDFGIAHLGSLTQMTHKGTILGTPSYMAPEQARSNQPLDARTDVFSLGCVLFECLTGARAFEGDHVMAVLAKVLFAEVTRVRELCPGIPEGLDELVARMLAKEPDQRPRNGAAVIEALAALGTQATGRASTLTGEEQQTISVVLIGKQTPLQRTDSSADTLDMSEMVAVPDALRRHARASGGCLEFLADGSVAVTIAAGILATDRAAQAARCALTLRKHAHGRPIALATGRRGESTARMPMNDAIDRAVRLLLRAPPNVDDDLRGFAPIAIDEVTAGLLDSRFEVSGSAVGLSLHDERDLAEGARKLLGKPTACVGRDREISMLEQILAECVEESVAQAVLVTAPAGLGKSRLAYELMRVVRQRSAPVTLWIGRGDSMSAGSAFGLLGQTIRGACGIRDGAPLDARRDKLRERVARHVSAADQRRVAEFLGEIIGTPLPDDASVPLRTARQDADIMSHQMRRAWEDFLAAECSTRPVLIVLEDCHWGDLPTMRFIDGALRNLKEKPWMVPALARPEVHELFPKLWVERGIQEIHLKGLTRKASERLVRQVLGDEVSPKTVDRLVAQADGNAFYLEELIRATVERRGEALPETVVTMVQSRLAGLDADVRRVLRAASVFGEVFWRGGVAVLLGGGTRPPLLDEWLDRLEQHEWITQRLEATFQGEREYVFRHAIVRDAAYAMLTDEDRALGHRLAGDWLERVGEPDVMVLAEHFDRGEAPSRAIGWYHRAAEQALEGNDLAAAIERAARAEAIGASGEVLGDLSLIRAEAHGWRGDNADAERWALHAMTALPEGRARWYVAVREAAKAAGKLGHNERLAALFDALPKDRPEDAESGFEASTTARLAVLLSYAGAFDQAKALRERLDTVAGSFRDNPAVSADIFTARAISALYHGYPDSYRELSVAAQAHFDRAGDMRAACFERAHIGYACNELGAFDEAAAILRTATTDAERMGLRNVAAMAKHNLGFALARTGALDEALTAERAAVLTFATQGDRYLEGAARCYLATILKLAGDLEGAEAEARRALEVLAVASPLQPYTLATLADTMLTGGRITEARAAAEQAAEVLESLGTVPEGEALVRLMRAETLEVSGEHDAARATIVTAREWLLARAAKIADPARRASFLERVPEHARILTLARAWVQAEPIKRCP